MLPTSRTFIALLDDLLTRKMKTSFIAIFKRRVLSTLINSINGITSAWKIEESFRIEVILTLVLTPIAFIVGRNPSESLILILSLILVLIVELINTAIEKTVDRISLEKNDASKLAKDLGSAAVFLTMIGTCSIWAFVLIF